MSDADLLRRAEAKVREVTSALPAWTTASLAEVLAEHDWNDWQPDRICVCGFPSGPVAHRARLDIWREHQVAAVLAWLEGLAASVEPGPEPITGDGQWGDGHADGWDDCRDAILAAAREGGAR